MNCASELAVIGGSQIRVAIECLKARTALAVLRAPREVQSMRLDGVNRRTTLVAAELDELLTVEVERVRMAASRTVDQRVDLNDVVRGSAATLRRRVGERVRTSIKLDNTPCVVMARSEDLEGLLINVVEHANQSMATGGSLTIETLLIDVSSYSAAPLGLTPGGYVALRVSDSGKGMSARSALRAFDVWFTATLTRWEGNAFLCSELDIGTTLTVFLPAVQSRWP